MRRSRSLFLWADPEGDMPLEYHHVSYILFRSDREDSMILGARCPEPDRFAVGHQLTDGLKLDEEAQAYLFSSEEVPLFVQTNFGVGILDKRYHRHAGVGIYWHIHGQPDGVARLLNRGVLGEDDRGKFRISHGVAKEGKHVRAFDLPLYERLQEVWRVVEPGPGAWVSCDGDGCLYGAELLRLVERISIFVGCRLTRDELAAWNGRIKCRRPALLEACLLCLLTEARAYSADGSVSCEVGSLGEQDGEGVALALRYPIEHTAGLAELLDRIHRHLGRVGDLSGLDLHAALIPPKRGEKKLGKLPSMQVNLDWIRDPTVLSTSDLKAKNDTNLQINP